ncbi:helix-hairpin-helix domain-containing protein [Microbacterium sp. JZ31]|uniref:helix-hairpin-helix domain-containing protein n=1 Tax=Microbacterium sp. JZ31 TaxID=1906274 RepID=UPI001934059A|nr:helix-hairpin-helix domain-containing protein [Microbacterium sp. JZ31]
MTTPATQQRAGWVFLLVASLWLVPVFGGPAWSWLGFGAAALMSAAPRLWWPAVGYTLAGFISVVIEDEFSDDVGLALRTLAWAACVVHGLVVYPGVLRRIAAGGLGAGALAAGRASSGRGSRPTGRRGRGDRNARATWHRAEPRPPERERPRREPVPEEARGLAAEAVSARSSLVADAPAPARPTVDVNKASRRVLTRLPGMDRRSAAAAVAERERRGGFASLDDFARAAGLQPHEAVRLRAHAFCSPKPRPKRTFARRVDL